MKKPEDIILKPSSDPQGLAEVHGYDFEQKFNLHSFLESLQTTGFQASKLAQAISIIKEMRKQKATIFLGYTSNMVSSGVRDIIAYLVKHKLVDVLVTTAGGVEEDIIKTKKPFLVGRFDNDDTKLREQGVNRIGNILVPNDRYIEFEKLMQPFFAKLHQKQQVVSVSDFIHELGKEIEDNNSIYYWASKNAIPTFCPPLTDGSIGDMLYFYKKKHPEFKIDISDDIVKVNDLALNAEKTGVIVLGGGLAKHHVINANLFREGADYAVYISTGSESDGSVSGAKPSEGVSWGKVRPDANAVHVEGDASIIFPLVMAGVLKA